MQKFFATDEKKLKFNFEMSTANPLALSPTAILSNLVTDIEQQILLLCDNDKEIIQEIKALKERNSEADLAVLLFR